MTCNNVCCHRLSLAETTAWGTWRPIFTPTATIPNPCKVRCRALPSCLRPLIEHLVLPAHSKQAPWFQLAAMSGTGRPSGDDGASLDYMERLESQRSMLQSQVEQDVLAELTRRDLAAAKASREADVQDKATVPMLVVGGWAFDFRRHACLGTGLPPPCSQRTTYTGTRWLDCWGMRTKWARPFARWPLPSSCVHL